MKKNILALIGAIQLIKMADFTISTDDDPIFGSGCIFAKQEHGEIKHLTVELGFTGQGYQVDEKEYFETSFDVPLDKLGDIATLVALEQVNMLNYAFNIDHLSEQELEAIKANHKGDGFVGAKHLIDSLGSKYAIYPNMVVSTEIVFNSVLDELEKLVKKINSVKVETV